MAKLGFYTISARDVYWRPFYFNSLISTYESKQTLTLNWFLNGLQEYTSRKQLYQFIFSPIPLDPICLNSVHFNCWPHEDESKRIPFFTVAQNHAAALYRIKSLDIKHITDWGGKKHIMHALPSLLLAFFFCPCQYGLTWIIYIPRTNFSNCNKNKHVNMGEMIFYTKWLMGVLFFFFICFPIQQFNEILEYRTDNPQQQPRNPWFVMSSMLYCKQTQAAYQGSKYLLSYARSLPCEMGKKKKKNEHFPSIWREQFKTRLWW